MLYFSKTKIFIIYSVISFLSLCAFLNLIENDQNEIIISINRKSRIIMKDGIKIVDQVHQIQRQEKKTISVKTSAPVCSKTKKFLQKKGIEVRER